MQMSVPTHIFTLLKDLIFFIATDHLFLFNTHNMKPISRIQYIGVMFPYFTNTFGLFVAVRIVLTEMIYYHSLLCWISNKQFFMQIVLISLCPCIMYKLNYDRVDFNGHNVLEFYFNLKYRLWQNAYYAFYISSFEYRCYNALANYVLLGEGNCCL